MERQLDVHTRRVAERLFWRDRWMYVQSEWLRGYCGETVGCTYKTSGLEVIVERQLDVHTRRVAERLLCLETVGYTYKTSG